MIEKIIAYSARNIFVVFLLVTFLTIWGVWSLRNTPLDAIPDLSDTQVIVFTEWPGRSPDLVEDQITYPITTMLLSAPQVNVVRGISMFGFSFVYVLFEDGTDIYWARSRVLEYLAGLAGKLPEGVSPTLGPDATGVGWVYEYALVDETGRHDLSQLRSFQDWYLRYWLQSVPGVSEVASVGGFVKQYQVNVDPNKLLAYNIPLRTVLQAVRMSNNDVGGRLLEWTGREYIARGRGYIRTLDDLRNVVVSVDGNATGTPILLRDLAEVSLGPDIRRGFAELDGKGEVVGGIVVARFRENARDVINRVKEKIEEVKDAFPEGIKLVPTYDRSELITKAVDTLKGKLIEESIIVSVVCIIFLFHFRSALAVILTLPFAILLSFIPMYYMKLTSNIMSLGGIAIAIGAMVDAAIVIVENVHKRLEHWEEKGKREDRLHVVIEAMKEVGKPIFFALLVITVSFIPVFSLQYQEGRLFKPLAFTKTFGMAFASILSITLTAALVTVLVRGRVTPEKKNPVNRFLIRAYDPVVKLVLRFKKTTLLAAVLIFAFTIPVFFKLGSEFMPPLYEGVLMDMPVTTPGISITEAQKVIQVRDKIIKSFPEVERVFGKVGRAETPTDPAPVSMIETNIILKPEDEWPTVKSKRWYSDWAPDPVKRVLGLVWPEELAKTTEDLINELNQEVRFPGYTNAWTMPIKARVDMLTTGIRTPVGIKIFGPDLLKIEEIGKEIEGALGGLQGTRSVYAERVAGGYYIDFWIKRDEAGRYGLRVEDVEDIIESAIGGEDITRTIEGPERYPVNVRYKRELRDEMSKLERVLVPTPVGAQVPLGQLADIRITMGPPEIKTEEATKVGYVYVDVAGVDIGSYVERAKRVLEENVKLPTGYFITWSGQYEYMQRVKERLKIVVPLTLLIIFVLLYLNFNDVVKTMIILLSVPFAAVGGIWLMYLLDYNMSVATWVGFIALAGLAAQTGVVMIIYLDEFYEKMIAEGRRDPESLAKAVHDGAVQRVRPKMMTVTAMIMGLLPLMWSHGAGADVMKRIAAPMVGGLVTSTVLTLIIIPAIYEIWRGMGLSKERRG
jgi:Cu(I)/Ag(I) efflux system membrane protein CusA/SilA